MARAPVTGPPTRAAGTRRGGRSGCSTGSAAPHATLLLFAGLDAAPADRSRLRDTADRVVAAVGDHVRPCVVVPDGRVPAELPAHAVVLDPEREAHRLYGATAEALYLVRPDGHVGFRGQPAGAEGVLDPPARGAREEPRAGPVVPVRDRRTRPRRHPRDA